MKLIRECVYELRTEYGGEPQETNIYLGKRKERTAAVASALFRLFLIPVVEVEIEIPEEDGDVGSLGAEVIEGPALFLGWTPCTASTTYEAAETVHLQ